MCGIIGQFRADIPKAALIAARDLLQHRGPDDAGFWSDGPVAFGFRRLSILDTSPAGHQPMMSASGRTTIIFNGEIYNYLELREELRDGYTFKTGSDTEVILAAYEQWGEQCFAKFNGMWAMAIWDRPHQRLILSRDRFGEKPLYWAKQGSGYIFASEIKALHPLRSIRPQPNERAVVDYLTFGFVDHTDQTFYQDIFQIQPGTYSILTESGIFSKTYWTLRPQSPGPHAADAPDRFRAVLTDSIRLRLRSDVPIGSCLSGGLDSSAIVLLARQIADQEKTALEHQTFTAYATDPKFDERQFSRLVNEQSGGQANEVFPNPDELEHDLDKLLWHQDEPFLSLSMFAQWSVMRRVHERKIKVVLDGQGGDEVLAGYLPYFGSALAGLLRHGRLIQFLKEWQALQRDHAPSMPDILPTLALYLLPAWLGRPLLSASSRLEFMSLQPGLRSRLDLYPRLPHPFRSPLKNHLYRLLTGPGLRALLHSEDRNSMAFSVEARVPFLDHRLAEMTLSLPDEQLLSEGETKRLLRRALKSVLPPAIRDRKDKMGFVVPQADWMRGALAEQIRETLTGSALLSANYLQPDLVADSTRRFLVGQAETATVVWRWYNLERWLRGMR